MKKYQYPEAVNRAVASEYQRNAPEALRLKIRALMHLPLVKPWQFVGSVLLLLASPLSFYLFRSKFVYSENLLLVLNIAAGVAAFCIIFAGVAHRYSDPKNKAELLGKLNAIRTKFS